MGLNSFGLDAFYVCAQEQNFTRAAHRLHLTQSALSQRIHNLENEIGASLFIRERLGVRLTEAGENLLRYCQIRAQLEEDIRQNVNNQDRTTQNLAGTLRIGGFSSVLRSIVLPSLQKISEKHPRVRFHLITAELESLPELLKTGKIDFMLLDHHWEREGVQTVQLGEEEQVRIRKKGREFNGTFLDHDSNDETTFKFLKIKKGGKIQRHYLDDIYGLIDGVLAGLGDAIVSKHLIKDLKGIEIIEGAKSQALKTPVILHYYDQPIQLPLHQLWIDSVRLQSIEILGSFRKD